MRPLRAFKIPCRAYSLDRFRLSNDFSVNLRVRPQRDKVIEFYARRNMAVDRFLNRLDRTAFCAALSGKAPLLDSEVNAFFADDHAVQVSPLFEVNNVTCVYIFGDEHAIEYYDLANGRVPGAVSECYAATFERSSTSGGVTAPKRVRPMMMAGSSVASERRIEHRVSFRTRCRRARASFSGMRARREGRTNEAANAANGDDLFQHIVDRDT